jgi:acyl carrier protein
VRLTNVELKRELISTFEGFLSQRRDNDGRPASPDRLISSGILTSLEVIEFVLEVEMRFGIEFSDNELSLDSFDSVDGLAATIERKLGQPEHERPGSR